MNKSLFSVVVFFNACTFCAPALAGLSAKEIMTKNEEARKAAEIQSSAVITTGGGGGVERVKQFTWWRKLTADKARYSTMTRFHSPAEVRGEGILFLEHENDQNDVMMYLPAFKKIRRVESQQQSGSFMGSEFSYADIATPHVDDYKYSLIKEETCPGLKLKCQVVESVPATEAVKERTGYTKTISWVREDNFMSVAAEFYGLDAVLLKKLSASEITEVDPTQHKWMALQLKIENLKSGRFTVLQFSAVAVNKGIPDSIFTQQNLSRVP
ncbi:outer membrane lipoprotein-sorting protein [Bdellovibrionota bacterium FG-2]